MNRQRGYTYGSRNPTTIGRSRAMGSRGRTALRRRSMGGSGG